MNLLVARSAVIAVLMFPHLLVSYAAPGAERAFLNPYAPADGSAVDAHGIRYRESDYRGNPPWVKDAIQTVAPQYPRAERLQRHQGRGMIQLTLNLQSGSVLKARLTRSTGFKTLDAYTLSALRQWRWRPGTWREINIGVSFTLHRTSTPLPPGAIGIPPSH